MELSPWIPNWLPDVSATRCLDCEVLFNLITRKHHCRVCGQIFCGGCTNQTHSVVQFVSGISAAGRVCSACFVQCEMLLLAEPLIRVFALLPFDVYTLFGVSKRWQLAVTTVRSVYCRLPTKLLHLPFTDLEKCLLKTHACGGHSCWTVRCLALQLDILPSKVTCRQLCCPSTCTPRLQVQHFVQLFASYSVNSILQVEWLVQEFLQLPIEDVCLFVPWWLQLGNRGFSFLNRTVLVLACTSLPLSYALHFECTSYRSTFHSDFGHLLLTRIPVRYRKEIRKTEVFMRAVASAIDGRVVSFPAARLPYNSAVRVQRIVKVCQLSSASLPHVVQVESDRVLLNILVKSEDVRKDQCTMVLCQMMERLCHMRCVHYSVLPLYNGGWIQMLPRAQTLYTLGADLSTSIFNAFEQESVTTVRAKFRRSVIGSCILSYVLGVGDRHLQNIVVADGELAHIDFAYMFGRDPKMRMTLRVTPPMIQMLGGKESSGYQLFVEGVAAGYLDVQLYTSFYCALLEHLAHIGLFGLQEIRDHVQSKLVGRSEELCIVDVVKNHSDTWVHTLTDVLHGFLQ